MLLTAAATMGEADNPITPTPQAAEDRQNAPEQGCSKRTILVAVDESEVNWVVLLHVARRRKLHLSHISFRIAPCGSSDMQLHSFLPFMHTSARAGLHGTPLAEGSGRRRLSAPVSGRPTTWQDQVTCTSSALLPSFTIARMCPPG